MPRLFIFSLLLVTVLSLQLDLSSISVKAALKGIIDDIKIDDFNKFAKKFKKTYNSLELLKEKAKTWKENMDFIEKINNEKRGYEVGENFFTDLDDNERSKYLMDAKNLDDANQPNHPILRRAKRGAEVQYVGEFVDWRGPFMPAIRDQGACGSCYAFAAINAIEVQWNSLGNPFSEFSEQFDIDCNPSTYSKGCDGGFDWIVMNYAYQNGSVPRAAYPYTGVEGTCKNDTERLNIVAAWYTLRSVADAEYYVFHKGPVSFGFYVEPSFLSYKSGIYNPPIGNCYKYNNIGGHAMTIVGFGSDKGIPYWIVRNQWGDDFGEAGYIRMRRGVDVCNMETRGINLPWVHGQTD
ncbi:unnamed protein product, partial [Mesorhabditis belari]|uniref:Uncharacterized protein n=1 Tax=Mesorhabditis belari TaxID=2138241 RepID=A0AAF3EZB6_9BILA